MRFELLKMKLFVVITSIPPLPPKGGKEPKKMVSSFFYLPFQKTFFFFFFYFGGFRWLAFENIKIQGFSKRERERESPFNFCLAANLQSV